jgi:hypothetical protein
MVDAVWFAARMQGMALVPEPLWWLMGAIVSFYFGARHQAKSQEFQRALEAGAGEAGAGEAGAGEAGAGQADTGPDAEATLETTAPSDNPALDDWRRARA